MNLMTGLYEEGQDRRNRNMELTKYMNWRVLPRNMKLSIRRYLNFVWQYTSKNREVEEQVMETLSHSLRSQLCVQIFGAVLFECPFLAWMTDDDEAVERLCLRMKAEFFEKNAVFIVFGELNQTVFIHWAKFEDEK